MARGVALATVLVVSLLVVSGAGGSDAQTPKRGGTVFMPADPEPACITPYIVACAGGPLITFMDALPRAVLPGAFEVRPDLTWKALLVSHVDRSTKPPLRLTYHIRPEARWSDGVPVTADDFLFTFRILTKYKAQLDIVDRAGVDLIRRIHELDAKTVRVVIANWDATAWLRYLFHIVLPQHVLEGEDYLSVWRERIENPKTGEPIGSGPFLVSGWERGKQLTLVRNPRYWGPHPAYVKRVALRFGLEGAPAAWLASGAVGVAFNVGPETIPSLHETPGVRVRWVPAPLALENVAINVRTGSPLLGKRLVRQALAYGIDRQAIVRTLFGATLPKQQVAQNGAYLDSSPYYRANWSRYSYRPAKARRLLAAAGCERGTDKIFVCDGKPLSLRFVTRGDVPKRRITLELVRKHLRQAGIEVVPEFASGTVAVGQIYASGKWDLLELANLHAGPPDELALTPLICEGSSFAFEWTSYCRHVDPDELSRADHTLRGRERARAVNEVDAALAEEVPLLPLYWSPTVAATGPSVRGYVLHPDDPFWRAEEWWLEAER